MDITSINALTSGFYPILQVLGVATFALLVVTVLSSLLVQKRNPENKRGIKAIRVTGAVLTVASFLAAAIIGIADEDASIEMKERSFAAAVKATYGESVMPGENYGTLSYGVASGGSWTKADFLVDGKLTTVTVKEIGGKWLLFDASGTELPRVTKA